MQTTGNSGAAPTFHQVQLRTRPPRVATFVPIGEGWETCILRMMENYSRVWGGLSNILVPYDGVTVPEWFWPLLRLFDPDRVTYYAVTWRGYQIANPKRFKDFIDREARRWKTEYGGTLKDARAQLTSDAWMTRELTGPPPSKLADEVIHWTSPLYYHGERVFEHAFRADDPISHPFVDVTEIEHPDPEDIVALKSESQTGQLLAALRWGAVSPGHGEKLKERSVGLSRPSVSNVEDDFLRAAIGDTSRNWELLEAFREAAGRPARKRPSFFREAFETQSPFHRTRAGCTWFRPTYPRWDERPFPFVIGDTCEDYCLALALDRLLGGAAWLPYAYVKDTGSMGSAIADGTRTVVWEVVHHGSLRRRPVWTSASLSVNQLRWAERRLVPKSHPLAPPEPLEVLHPSELVIQGCQRLFCTPGPQNRTEAFQGETQAANVETPIPEDLTTFSPSNLSWHTDALIDAAPLPARAAINSLVVAGHAGWLRGNVRSGVDGTSYYSHGGFIETGAPLEQVVFKPKLRRAGALAIFEALLHRRGLVGRPSDDGLYMVATVELWGSLRALASDLRREESFNLLSAYLSQANSATAPGIYLRQLRRRFLSFTDARATSGIVDEAELADLLDSYVQRRILRRGFVLYCSRCRFAGWYELGEVTDLFTCQRCRTRNPVVRAAWKDPTQPDIYYQLDEVVYQALSKNVEVPVLALDELSEAAEVAYAPSLQVGTDAKLDCEVDILALPSGKVVIGEAKTVNTLASSAKTERQKLARLVQVAEAVSADELVLVTTKRWRKPTIERAQDAVAQSSVALRLLEDL